MTYLISLILLLLPTYLIRFSVFGIPSTVLEVLIYTVFLYGLWQARKAGFKPIPFLILIVPALMIVALIISTIIAPDKRVALGELKGFFIDPFIFLWLLWQFAQKEKLLLFFGSLSISGLFVAIHTIIQKILGHVTPDGRVIGIFGYSPNYLALFLMPISVLVFGLGWHFLAKKKVLWSLGADLTFILIGLAIYFSGSRGGILALVFGIGIFFLAKYWYWIRERFSSKVIVIVLILVAIYTAWTFIRPDFSASPDSGRVASSNNVRFQIWQTSWELGITKGVKNAILGVGLGNFQNAFDKLTKDRANFPEYITPMALTPHNIFLMFWLSTGILGLLSLLGLFALFIRQALKHLSAEYAPIILSVFSSIIIYGLVEASIWKNDLSIIFFFFWGIVWLL